MQIELNITNEDLNDRELILKLKRGIDFIKDQFSDEFKEMNSYEFGKIDLAIDYMQSAWLSKHVKKSQRDLISIYFPSDKEDEED